MSPQNWPDPTRSRLGAYADDAVADEIDPTVGRERLCRHLKTLRLQHDLTQQQVANALGWSASKVLRLEAGHNTTSADDLDRLLVLYRLDEATRRRLVALAHSASRQPWASYRDVLGSRQITALRQESAASAIRCYQPALIPDLLQTPAYASCVLDLLTPPTVSHTSRRRLLDVLRTRQQHLRDEGGPRAEFVISEEALLRGIHAVDPSIVIEQLNALAHAATWPRLTIQVLPLTAGLPGVITPFTLLSLPDVDDELLWLGYHQLSIVRLDRADDVHHHREVYTTIIRRAADPAQSLSIIASVAVAIQRLCGRPVASSTSCVSPEACVQPDRWPRALSPSVWDQGRDAGSETAAPLDDPCPHTVAGCRQGAAPNTRASESKAGTSTVDLLDKERDDRPPELDIEIQRVEGVC